MFVPHREPAPRGRAMLPQEDTDKAMLVMGAKVNKAEADAAACFQELDDTRARLRALELRVQEGAGGGQPEGTGQMVESRINMEVSVSDMASRGDDVVALRQMVADLGARLQQQEERAQVLFCLVPPPPRLLCASTALSKHRSPSDRRFPGFF